MTEILVTIAIGIIVAIVSQLLAHYLAVKRDASEHAQDCDTCGDKEIENES